MAMPTLSKLRLHRAFQPWNPRQRLFKALVLVSLIVFGLHWILSGFSYKEKANPYQSSRSCQFPILEPGNQDILKVVETEFKSLKLEQFSCGNDKNSFHLFEISTNDPDPRLHPIREEIQSKNVKSCCYFVAREGTIDDSICHPVSLQRKTKIPEEHEFIAVECMFRSEQGSHFSKQFVDTFAFVRGKSARGKHGNKKEERYNVLVLGLDSMSRLDFVRTMPETREFLINQLNAVEFQGLNRVGASLLSNLGPMLTNHPAHDNLYLDCFHDKEESSHCPFIWKKYSHSGFLTSYAEDSSTSGVFRDLYLNVSIRPTDYFLPAFLHYSDELVGHHKLHTGNVCFGPRSAFSSMMTFIKSVFSASFSDQNIFQFAWSSSLTRELSSGGKLIDRELHQALKLLKKFQENNQLKKTVIILLSTNGHKSDRVQKIRQHHTEENNPFLYVVLPSDFGDKKSQAFRNLIGNVNRLLTPWDIYQTLNHLIHPKTLEDSQLHKIPETYPGTSLFLPVSEKRSCELAGIPEDFCNCNRVTESLSVTDPRVKDAGKFLLKKMNSIVSAESTRCAHLILHKILYVEKVTLDGHSYSYRLTFQTNPGLVTFQAVVMPHVQYWRLLGSIDRKSDASLGSNECFENMSTFAQAKLYCSCLD